MLQEFPAELEILEAPRSWKEVKFGGQASD